MPEILKLLNPRRGEEGFVIQAQITLHPWLADQGARALTSLLPSDWSVCLVSGLSLVNTDIAWAQDTLIPESDSDNKGEIN